MLITQAADGRVLRQRSDGGKVVRTLGTELRALFAALNGSGDMDAERAHARAQTDRAIAHDRIGTMVLFAGL